MWSIATGADIEPWSTGHAESTGPEFAPAPDYLDRMLTGSRHWELPIGWILRLEDHLNSIP